MATRPYFTGDYGAHLARVDTRPIIEAGRAQGQLYANLGGQIGNVIQQYGLNKQKREEMTNEIESAIRMNPGIVTRLTGTGDEAFDKKQQTAIDKLTSGDANMTVLRGLAGDIARLEKQDLKEQAEATARSQAISDQLNQELLRQNVAGKKQSNLEAQRLSKLEQEKKEQEDQMYEWGNERIHFLLGEAGSDPDFDPTKLDLQDQILFANYQAWVTKNFPISKIFVKPGDKVELDALRQGYKQALQNYEKGGFELMSAEQKVEQMEGQLSDEQAARKPGAFANWEDAAVKQEELWNLGFVTKAVSNPYGGVDIVDQKRIADAEQQNEFTEVKDFPGHFVRKGDSHLYRKDANGKLEQVGAPRDTQQMGQLQDAVDSMKDKFVTYYMDISGRGKLLKYNKNGKLLPKSKWVYIVEDPDEDGDLVEKKVPYNEQHEITVRRINAAQKKIDGFYELDVTP